MNCKVCGRPIEQSIEGELICERCWCQLDDDARACDAAIAEYERTTAEDYKCPDCGRKSEELGYDMYVDDVLMECPFCGLWQLWSKRAGLEVASVRI